MGVGGWGGGGTSESDFLTKTPNLQKKIVFPFFGGVGEGGLG